MLPKTKDKVKFTNQFIDWFKDFWGNDKITPELIEGYRGVRFLVEEARLVSEPLRDYLQVKLDGYHMYDQDGNHYNWINIFTDGTFVATGSPVVFVVLEDGNQVNPDLCSRCQVEGNKIRFSCVCSQCGKVLWGA